MDGAVAAPGARGSLIRPLNGSLAGLLRRTDRLLLAAAALPPLGMAIGVARFGLDVPFWDDWQMAGELSKLHAGTLTWGDVWPVYNGHRMLVPRLVALEALDLTGSLRALMWISVALAYLTFLCLLLQIRVDRAGRGVRASLVLAASLLLFSAIEFENWTMGFQIHWYLGVFASVASLLALTRWPGSGPAIAAAIAGAAVGTFSSAHGLAVWPAGAIAIGLLWKPGHARVRAAVAWVAAAAAALTLFFHDYQSPPGQLSYVAQHPRQMLSYVLTYVGNWAMPPMSVLGRLHVNGVAARTDFAALTGTFALVWAVVVYWPLFRCRRPDPLLLASAPLAAYALGAAVLTAIGRLDLGVDEAFSNRYAMISTLFWVALLMPSWGWLRARLPSRERVSVRSWAVYALLAVPLVGGYACGYVNGVIGLRDRAHGLAQAAPLLLDVDHVPDASLYVFWPDATSFRALVKRIPPNIPPFSYAQEGGSPQEK